MRNGLKNASGTKFQLHGAAHGNGIYLATNSGVSLGYAGGTHQFHQGQREYHKRDSDTLLPHDLVRGATGNRLTEDSENVVILALCEVIDHHSLIRSRGA